MSLSVKRKTKLNPFQVYAFIYRFEAKLREQFPASSLVLDKDDSFIVSPNDHEFKQF